ncbi:MAG: DUF421 domain-containing protein [Vicinamibacteraceae bacterium]|nr:DUF421 domain-containing protein [Vicinamibacteraceae bacterium]
MEPVVRAAAVYVLVLLVVRISGKRTLAEITTFDLVLLLLIGEATQQALLGDDFSVTNAAIVIATLTGLDLAFSRLKQHSRRAEQVLDGVPLLIVDHGRPLKDRMEQEGVDEWDVMAAAREKHGLQRLEQVKYAVLEVSGGISIVPIDAPTGS